LAEEVRAGPQLESQYRLDPNNNNKTTTKKQQQQQQQQQQQNNKNNNSNRKHETSETSKEAITRPTCVG